MKFPKQNFCFFFQVCRSFDIELRVSSHLCSGRLFSGRSARNSTIVLEGAGLSEAVWLPRSLVRCSWNSCGTHTAGAVAISLVWLFGACSSWRLQGHPSLRSPLPVHSWGSVFTLAWWWPVTIRGYLLNLLCTINPVSKEKQFVHFAVSRETVKSSLIHVFFPSLWLKKVSLHTLRDNF